MQRIVGIGHSHLHAYSRALKDYAESHPDRLDYTGMCLLNAPYVPAFIRDGLTWLPNPVWQAELQAKIAAGATVYFCLAGSHYWNWSLTPGPAPFDFVDPEADDAAPLIGEMVPYDIVRALARQSLGHATQVVDFVLGLGARPLLQFLPPPPIRDLTPDVGLPAQRKSLAELVESTGISPPSFRMKMWRMCRAAMLEAFGKYGIPCIDGPAGALDAGGYLRPEFIGDALHANSEWGRLQMRHLLDVPDRVERAA